MTNDIVISHGLRLPVAEIKALLQGRLILAISNSFKSREKFALYPIQTLESSLSIEGKYHSNFWHIARNTVNKLTTETTCIKAWAKCEWCHDINPASLDKLSELTIWTKDYLKERFQIKQSLFLLYLRVYLISEPIEIFPEGDNQFFVLPKSLSVSDSNPVLPNKIFATRKHQLEKLEPSQSQELEEFLDILSPLALTNSIAKQLEKDTRAFLGWNTQQLNGEVKSNLAWTKKIAVLGNRSKEEDQGKSNYQAGTDFENIVRQSLEFLGFSVDYFHKGGAGGVDVFCSHPYPLVGECKSGKTIPNNTAVQLLNLGTLRLQNEELLRQATKLIIGPGEATPQLKDAAKVHGMSIINPETLEKLVKLQDKYPNSIDLFKLQIFLKAGQSDTEVEKYISQIEKEIELRSYIIRAVKELSNQHTESFELKQKSFTVTEIRAHYNATRNPKLRNEFVHNILIELSSPLTGYLGRIKGTDWKTDKFYFLRDL